MSQRPDPPGGAGAAGPSARPWWEHPQRIVQLNLTLEDAGADGAMMARRAHEYGANALLLNAGGIYAFYPTEVPFHRRAPGLAGDLLGDAVGYCHASGLRVIVRFDLSGLHRDAFEAHPEWFYRSAGGRPLVDKGLYTTCPHGGWWQERFFALWDEVARRYAVDGLFFNAWGHKERTREGEVGGPCRCLACQRLLRERFGGTVPDPQGEQRWEERAFRRQTLDDLGRRIYRYVKAAHPRVALFAGAGHRALSTSQADCTEIELHCGSAGAGASGRWRHAAGESCKLVASLGPGFASGINAVYCHVGPGRWRLSAAPPGWLGYTLAQTLANAGWPYTMLIGTLDAQPDRTSLPRLRDLLHFARSHEDDYRDLQSVAPVALLWSERTATAGPGWSDPGDRYVKHFRGWYDRLTRRQRLFDVLSDAQLEGSPGQLAAPDLRRRYAVLIAPNPARLSAGAGRVLDEYVALGGRLVVTGAPPAAGASASASASASAAAASTIDALGADAVLAERSHVSNSYFRVRPEAPEAPVAPVASEIPATPAAISDSENPSPAPPSPSYPSLQPEGIDLLPVEGRLWHVSLRPGAVPCMGLIPPEDYGAPEQTTFEITTDHPGAIWYRHGQGASCYLPWEPDRAWYETGSEALGRLLDLVVEGTLRLDGTSKGTPEGTPETAQPVSVVAPEAVELTAHRQRGSGRLLVHLVNGSGGTPPRWAEPVPVHDLVLRFRLPAPAGDTAPAPAGRGATPGAGGAGALPVVRAARAGAFLAPRPVAGGFEVTLPRLDLFELLAVEPPAGSERRTPPP